MTDSMRIAAIINGDAYYYNLTQIKEKLPEGTLIMPVIKADAYGHGAAFAAKVAEPFSDYYAVAIIEEAISLRNSGVTKPIMLLGHTSCCDFEKAVKNNITLTVFTYEAAKELSLLCEKMSAVAKIHIALDTGMRRIGFKPDEESILKIRRIAQLPNIFVEGIFSHFASADEKDKEFSYKQTECFDAFIKMLEKENINIPIKHISNSAAIMELPKSIKTMVRPGIILYGLYPSDEVLRKELRLKPVMELISRVAYVKEIEEGDSVSYGCTFTANKKMKIATIPVGYADGYPRLLSNKGRVIINGKYAPIVGRVCMDQFMVDVTEIDDVKELDKVILIGSDGDKTISCDEIASIAQTINYEVVCDISKRVPRIYMDVTENEK